MASSFNIRISTKARHVLSLQGVPNGLLTDCSINLNKWLYNFKLPDEKKSKWVDIELQQQWFNTLLTDLPITPYTLLIVSTQYYFRARQLALLLFWQYLRDSMNYPQTYGESMPVWHSVNLDFRNYLMEDYKRGKHTRPNLLVLDGVYYDMPHTKRDKIHDIMQNLCDRPRVLIFRGPDPFNFCINTFGVRPNYIVNMDQVPQQQTRVI